MNPQFGELLERTDQHCRIVFGERFRASYVHGSVAYGDAIDGESDLDFIAFVDEQSSSDRTMAESIATEMESEYTVAKSVHVRVTDVVEFAKDPFNRFILKHNAVRISGTDVISAIERDYGIPAADYSTAKKRLPFARQCLEQLNSGECPGCVEELPTDTSLRLRKIARAFVVIEGAYYLMAIDRFVGFEIAKVLATLSELFPEYQSEIKLTRQLAIDPSSVQVDEDDFLKFTTILLERFFSRIEQAAAST